MRMIEGKSLNEELKFWQEKTRNLRERVIDTSDRQTAGSSSRNPV